MTRPLTLNLPDMTCAHCEAAVTGALKTLDPTMRVAVDLAAHQITLETGAGLEDVLSALCEAGFEATLAA